MYLPANEGIISVVIVEDDPGYRNILHSMIEGEKDMIVGGVFQDAESYLEALGRLRPRIAILDIKLPGMSGIEAVTQTKKRSPETEIMICTCSDDEEAVVASLRAGAWGYIHKSATLTQVLDAIRQICDGGAPLTPRIARKALGVYRADKTRALVADELTRREAEILHLLGEGKSYQAVCETLYISYGTVQSHVKSIYSKLQVHSKSEVVAWLAEQRVKYPLFKE
jgi:two-component system, NarL family, response regulator LiaR